MNMNTPDRMYIEGDKFLKLKKTTYGFVFRERESLCKKLIYDLDDFGFSEITRHMLMNALLQAMTIISAI
jgi:hypothetical protein